MKDAQLIPRRRIVRTLALAVALSSGSAMAQAWPSKSISLIVPFPPEAPRT